MWRPARLLEPAALRGSLTGEQAARWTAVTSAYVRAQALGGSGDDPLGRAVTALACSPTASPPS
ncbi:hypothetical protein, partial [Streptomyces glaucescens]|uniref:hypothetical protein n=1 Tax=Streptomyces glaucescens TaxID=1907 RepID=UPI00146FA4D9